MDSTNASVGRHDGQGSKVESRGSRRSVVFQKIKNPPPPATQSSAPPVSGFNGNSAQMSASKQQLAVGGTEKQLNSANLSSNSQKQGTHFMQQVNGEAVSQFNQQLQPGRQIKIIQQQLNPVNQGHHRMNPPNTVKLGKSNIKNMGGLSKAASNMGQQTLTIFQQQSQLVPAQSGRMMLMQPNHGIGLSTPGGFTILANGQPGHNDQRTTTLKPLNHMQNGGGGGPQLLEHEATASKLDINLQQLANQSQQMFQMHAPAANQTAQSSSTQAMPPSRIQKQASSSMVNGVTQSQSNQQMRFQLNSKRFSNVKDASINGSVGQASAAPQVKSNQSAKSHQHQFNTHQQQPQQQYSQSVMRNHVRLAKKVNSNNMAQQQFYDVQLQGMNSGVPSQNGTLQNFNKTMNNFVSNQNLNLNGQKLLISSSQAPVSSSHNPQVIQSQLSQSNLSNHMNLQQTETTAQSTMHHTKMNNEDRLSENRAVVAQDHVLNSANLTAQDLHMMQFQSLHQKGSSNFQLQPQQSENNLESRKIMLGLAAQNGRLGQGMAAHNGQGQLSNSKQNQRSALGESRPQSQNNKMTGVQVSQQHSLNMQPQQNQQFNQVHLNGLSHHNMSKAKQLNFSPGYSQQLHQQYNQDQFIMQQLLTKQQMHTMQQQPMNQMRANSIGPQAQQYALVNKNGAPIQSSPASQKATIPNQLPAHGKGITTNDLSQAQQSPAASQGHGPSSAQKLLSMKHIQIQNARMANSQSDNYNSDNESNAAAGHGHQFSAQLQSANSTQNGLTVSPQQPVQMGLTPSQKQEKLNLIRANSIQSQGGKFIKNQLSLLQRKQQSLEEGFSNNEGSANDIILGSNGEPQWKNADHICLNGGLKRDVSPGQLMNYDSQRQNRMVNGGSSPETKQQQSMHQSGLALKNGDFGMTLEDDVESMLSDQFNTSNESMFKVRGVTASGQTQLGGGLAGGGGDSTFRCNDSIQDEDRGLISESEDGWYAERDNPKNQDPAQHDNFDDISEHSSDEMTDSDNENPIPGDGTVKKTKKKGEKGERKKKKKKKAEQQIQSQNQADLQGHENGDLGDRKLVQTYKKLEDNTKEGGGGGSKKVNKQEAKGDQKQANQDNKKSQKKKDMGTTQIKVNLERKSKGTGNEKAATGNNNANDSNQNKNMFQSPNVKCKNEKQPAAQSKQNTNNKKDQASKNDKKQFMDDKEIAKQLAALDQIKNSGNQGAATTPLKKPKKNGLKLQALNHALPKNLQECYDRFFESGFKINPQFEYENASQAQKFLEQFVEPDGQYLEIAKKILDSFLKEYGSESNYLDCEGRKLDQEETHKYIKDYLQALGVEEWISINFQKNQVAPTSVTHDPKTGKCKMNIKLPCEYREGRMIGVLDHEIGTHFLRKHNEKLQQWYKKREKFDMKTCIATEEGLACTNQMVQTVKDGNCKPFLYRSALNYYASYMAKELSFVDLFKDLERYVDSPQARWKFTLRVKRGLSDTSQKGGLYKDQVYLEGAVKILQQRHQLNFKALLCGKISLDDYHRDQIYSILNYEGIILPPFMEDMDEYLRCLDIIGHTNHIVALDEISDNASQEDTKQQEAKNEFKIDLIESQEKPLDQMEAAGDNQAQNGNAAVTNFLKENDEGQQADHNQQLMKEATERSSKWDNADHLGNGPPHIADLLQSPLLNQMTADIKNEAAPPHEESALQM